MRKIDSMKRWIPFVLLILFVFILVNFLLITGQTDKYIPQTSDLSIVFKEACVTCHGEEGKGNGLLYPGLTSKLLSEEEIVNIVRNGELFMPSFPHIPDSTLNKLAVYVAEKKFINKINNARNYPNIAR